MENEQPNYQSTPGEIIDYYDSHPNLTLGELSNMTGKSIAYLKGLLMHPQKGESMKKQFIQCKTYRTAYKRAPWACAVCRVCGGFWAFESATDYFTFKGQK